MKNSINESSSILVQIVGFLFQLSSKKSITKDIHWLVFVFLLLGFNTSVNAELDKHNPQNNKEILSSTTRGKITDRNGEVLANNIQMLDIWVNPREWNQGQTSWKGLMVLLSLNEKEFSQKISESKKQDKTFIYLKRKVDLDIEQQINSLAVKGVYQKRVYFRSYPHGEFTSQLVGVTNIDDIGQEGLERHFEEYLKPSDQAQENQNKQDLQLSIDLVYFFSGIVIITIRSCNNQYMFFIIR